MGKIIRVTTGSVLTEIVLPNMSYESIKKQMGCWFEIVHPKRLAQGLAMVVDEEGLLKGLPINLAGCYLYETDKHGQSIVGDIYIFSEEWDGDGYNLAALAEPDIAYVKKLLGEIVTIKEKASAEMAISN